MVALGRAGNGGPPGVGRRDAGDTGTAAARASGGGRRERVLGRPAALTHARDLIGRPVVTLAGDDIAQVKDVVYSAADGSVIGFTLAGRGMLSGPMRAVLPWRHIHAVGPHAVIVTDDDRLTDSLPDCRGEAGDVLGDTVLTVGGTALGTVTDVIVDQAPDAEVVGFEVETGKALAPAGRRVFIPRPGRGASSGEAIIIVPDAVTTFVVNDLFMLASPVASFRDQTNGHS